MHQEKPLAEGPSFTFYTYSNAGIQEQDRWKQTGIPDIFFHDLQEARAALLGLRNDLMSDPEVKCSVMHLERIQTAPISKISVLALLNEGPGALVERYEIIEIFEPMG